MQADNGRRKFLWLAAGGAVAGVTGRAALAAAKENWFSGINRVRNPAQITDLERSHAPVISVEGEVLAGQPFQLNVRIGEAEHTMSEGHLINWIEIYISNDLVARVEFTHIATTPELTIPLSLLSDNNIKVWSYCNRHGLWESIKEITVT